MLAFSCTVCALDYMYLHELSHLSEGHTQYAGFSQNKQNQSDKSFDTHWISGPELYHQFEFVADCIAMQTGLRMLWERESILDNIPEMNGLLGYGMGDRAHYYLLSIRMLYLTISMITSFYRGKSEMLSVFDPMSNAYPPIIGRRSVAEKNGFELAYGSVKFKQIRWASYERDRKQATEHLDGFDYMCWEESGLKSLVEDVASETLMDGYKKSQHEKATRPSPGHGYKELQPVLLEAKLAWILGDHYDVYRKMTRKDS
jgi:hypothetical protein